MDVVMHKIEVDEVDSRDEVESFEDLACTHEGCGGEIENDDGHLVCRKCGEKTGKISLNFHRVKNIACIAAGGGTDIAKLDYTERVKFSQKNS